MDPWWKWADGSNKENVLSIFFAYIHQSKSKSRNPIPESLPLWTRCCVWDHQELQVLTCYSVYPFMCSWSWKKKIVIIGDFFVSLPKQNNLSAAIWSALSRETVKCSFSDLNFDAFSVSQDPELCIRWNSNYCAEWIKLRLTQHPYYLKFI